MDGFYGLKIIYIDPSCLDEDEFSLDSSMRPCSVWLWWIHDIFHRCMCILTFHVCESVFMLHFTIHEWISKDLEENEVKCVIYLSYNTKMQTVRMRSLINVILRHYISFRHYYSNSFYQLWIFLVWTVYENGSVLVKMPQNIWRVPKKSSSQ